MKKIVFIVWPFFMLVLQHGAHAQLLNIAGYHVSETSNLRIAEPIVKSITLSSSLKLEYVEQGDSQGIPVLFLHGYTDSWRSFESVLTLLPKNIHAFAITQRGHGNSSRPQKGYAPGDFANDIAAFVKKLKLGPVVVIGHSMGGTVAQRLVIDHPELVKGFVLAGTFASFRTNTVMAELYRDVLALKDPISRNFAREFQKSTVAQPISESSMNKFVDQSMKLPARIWKSVLGGLMTVDYTAELKQVNKKALIIYGDKDSITPNEDQEILLSSIRNSRLLIYDEVGHSIHWEQPVRFVKDIVAFISSL